MGKQHKLIKVVLNKKCGFANLYQQIPYLNFIATQNNITPRLPKHQEDELT